jgi:predicted nucleic acid-binding protein
VKVAYVDTSCLVCTKLNQPGSAAVAKKLGKFDQLFSANLLEAEIHSVLARERIVISSDFLKGIRWIIPNRTLHDEIAKVLSAGYVRGADCWHLAAALYLAEDVGSMSFLTLDERQRSIARSLGFGE